MLENKTILVLLNGAMSKKQDLKISWGGGVNHPPPLILSIAVRFSSV